MPRFEIFGIIYDIVCFELVFYDHELFLFAHVFFTHEFHEFTRNMLNYINGDLIGRTNFH